MIRLPQLSPTSLGNPAAPTPDVSSGINQIANAIGQVSGAFVQISHDIARADNARKKSEFRQTLGKNYADLQIQLQTITDPQERLTRTNDFLASQRAAVDNPDFPPVLVEELRTYYDDFATTAQIRSAQDAAELTQTRARKAIQNELEAAKQYNDPVAFQNAVTDYVESGLGLPEDGEALMADFQQSAAETNFLDLIQQEPQGALLDLQSEDFSTRNPSIIPSSIPKLQRYAEGLIQDRRAQEIDLLETAMIEDTLTEEDIKSAEYITPNDRAKFMEGMDKHAAAAEREALELQGLKGPLTPEQIDAAKHLSPLEKEKLKAEQTTLGIPLTHAHSQAWDRLFALRRAFENPTITDEQYAAMFNDTRTAVLSEINPKYSGDLRQELTYRSPANRKGGAAKPGAIPRNKELGTSGKARIKKAFDDGVFGDPNKIESFDKFTAYSIQLSNWLDDKPQATWPDVIDYTNQLINGEVAEAPDLTIPTVPGHVGFDDRVHGILGNPNAKLPPNLQVPGGADSSLLPPKPKSGMVPAVPAP
jgi:hypothetical protein